ncbi:MAG: rRNA maturation RNase YbeY [Candidatus Brocadiales bacterium]
MKITVTNLQDAHPIKKRRVREVVKEVLRRENMDAELNIAFVDKDEITKLNKRFLGHKEPTDVLSFLLDTGAKGINGEIAVCVPVAVEYAAGAETDVEGEVMLYVVHGVLHLLGYDDLNKKNARTMHLLERDILSGLGYTVADV